MPATLPNLYVNPSDLWDFLSSEGVDLRLDDHNLATGQKIVARTAALAGDTSLAVTALVAPLLPGTTINFDGGGMPAVASVVLTSTGKVGDTTLLVASLPAAIPPLANAWDSGVNVATAARLLKACQYGTSQVKLYCCARYDDSQLVLSWSVNRWATLAAAKWLTTRRGQSAPGSIKADWEEALEEMRQVMVGMLQIEDIAPRTSSWPFISNVTVDINYNTAKVRVEQSISEATPTQYGQYVDWNSVFLLEW